MNKELKFNPLSLKSKFFSKSMCWCCPGGQDGMEVISGCGITVQLIREITVCGVCMCVCVCVCVGSGLNSACVWRRGRSWGTGQGHNAYKTSKDQGSQGATEGFSSGERLIVIFEKDHSAWHLVESGQNRRLGSCHHKTA